MNAKIVSPYNAVFVGVVAFLITACASARGPQQSPSEWALQRTQIALKEAGDADSLAAAAELDWQTGNHTQRLTLLNRAVALAPDRVDLVRLQLEACAQIRTCDPTPIAAALHGLDPENGASWAPLLNRTVKGSDAKALVNDLSAIGKCKRFDVYWNTSIAHLTTALIKVHTMDVTTALTAVIGAEAALAIPAYESISKACQPPASNEPGRLSTCRNIAATMRSGDTYISEMIGIAIAKRVWPATSAEYADAVAERRLGQYRMRTAGDITVTTLHNSADALEYIRLLSHHRAEQEVALALITRAGKNPTPPAAWNESYPQ